MGAFISYSSKDREFVEKLAEKLVERRVNVWLDKWEMKPGDSLIDKIQKGLMKSSYLIVVLSKNSVESEWCKKELHSMLMREMKEGETVVVPILIEDCDIPYFLLEKMYANFKDDFETGFEHLMTALAPLSSKHMTRETTEETITDYSSHYWLDGEEGRFKMTIDFITWYNKEKKSILLQLEITGSEDITKRFIQHVHAGRKEVMRLILIHYLYQNKELNELNIRISAEFPYLYDFYLYNENNDVLFDIKMRAILLGDDTGFDVLIHLANFLEILYRTSEINGMLD